MIEENFRHRLNKLNHKQREILEKLSQSNATLLFNIKGMVQIVYEKQPYEFLEMGFEDIQNLLQYKLIYEKEDSLKGNILEHRTYALTEEGKHIVEELKKNSGN
ncbi:MAG: hypothetical protein Tsb0021_12380 [Chlamydiales bacterium]